MAAILTYDKIWFCLDWHSAILGILAKWWLSGRSASSRKEFGRFQSRGHSSGETGAYFFLRRLSQKRAFMVEIGAVEIGKLNQRVVIVKRDPAGGEGHELGFAQFAQHTVDVHRRKSQRIGQQIL